MTTALAAPEAAPRRAAAGLHVAALIDTALVSGPGRQLAALALELARQGVTLTVVMFQRRGRPLSPYVAYLERLGVPVRVVEERGRFDLSLLGRVRATLDALRPDVVQTHNYKTTAVAWLLRRLGARWPWLAFHHGATAEDRKVELYHQLERSLLRRADHVVVMAERQRASLAPLLGDRVEVLHNAVLELPDDAEPLVLPAVPGGGEPPRPRLGVIGRLSHEKGVDVFLEACAILRGRGVPFSALVAGDGPERARLEAQRAALRLEDTVHLLGGVSAVRALYQALDLVVIPSRSEGLPNVLLEALRFDRAVVSTAVGAVPEVLAGSEAGVVVPPERADLLADAIERALAMRDTAPARAARAAVVERFSLARRASEHLRLYTALLGARR